jgi:hypothetical protein
MLASKVLLAQVASFVLLFGPSSIRADETRPVKLTKETALGLARDMAKRTNTVLEMADLLDELTKTRTGIVLKSAGRTPVAEKTLFGVEFRVPEVEFEDAVTNTAFGAEIPGRRVSVKLWVDCDVECRVNVANIKLARHEDYADTVILTLPKLEVIGHVPEGREYRFETDFGVLRNKWWDSEVARSMRKEMLSKAGRKAANELANSEMMVEFRKGVKRELRAVLRPTLPAGRRIEVKFEEE